MGEHDLGLGGIELPEAFGPGGPAHDPLRRDDGRLVTMMGRAVVSCKRSGRTRAETRLAPAARFPDAAPDLVFEGS